MNKTIGFLIPIFLISGRLFAQFNCGDTLVDSRDGQKYPTTQIGNQCWMAKSLNYGIVLKILSTSLNQTNNGTVEKFCFDDDSNKCNIYGGLYQWDELMNYTTIEKSQGICPAGWHIPSVSEFDSLIAFLPYHKTIRELIPGGSTGFNLLFSGYCSLNGGIWLFGGLNSYVNLRTSTQGTMTGYTYVYYSYPADSLLYKSSYPNRSGYSARCIYDGGSTGINNPGIKKSGITLNTVVSGKQLTINYKIAPAFNKGHLQIINTQGSFIKEIEIRNQTGTALIDLSGLKSSLYILRLQLDSGASQTTKFIIPE
jgi:uncharacterized protein (TIGR02145 family)